MIKQTKLYGLLLTIASTAAFSSAVYAQEKVANTANALQLVWELQPQQAPNKKPFGKLIIKNKGSKPITLTNHSIWFSSMKMVDVKPLDNRFLIEHKNGDLFKINFLDKNKTFNPNDTVQLQLNTANWTNYSITPSGFYVVDNSSQEATNITDYTVSKKDVQTEAEKIKFWNYKYEINALNNQIAPQSIIPLPKEQQIDSKQQFQINQNASISADPTLQSEVQALTSFFANQTKVKLVAAKNGNSTIRLQHVKSLKAEAYQLTINGKGILIEAADPAGAFYAIQSLKSLIPHTASTTGKGTISLPYTVVKDEPRYAYRGFMLDVARNFHSKAEVKKILDVMAMYKLNKFHFHLIDDEGWRLEIPALPELTAVGANRSAAFTNGNSLQPSYGSGANGREKQYYTVADYIEILQYAKARHIAVIPEVETPGHARAAIKSMRARYNKYKQAGNLQKAEEFLLDDAEDKSVYSSAQVWNDNVMNPALNSTYHFLSTVIDAIKQIHEQGGMPLTLMDLGGDETPRGVWEKSPKVLAFMKENNIQNVLDVWPYYINRINKIVQEKGLKLSGWEEMGMRNKGKGMDVNPDLANDHIQLNVWNNIPGSKQEDLAYRLANAGYKVVYTSAANNYLDITWDNNFTEAGHTWVGTTNIHQTYSFAPDNFFINLRKDGHGDDLKEEIYTNKVALTEDGKKNIIGIKGALWSELIRNDQRLEEMIFPRLIAIADRAWSVEQNWEKKVPFDSESFKNSYSAFMQKLATDELPKLDRLNQGYNYRFPSIGIKQEGQQLSINTDYPGYKVYYTNNGSEPSSKSTLVNGTVPYEKGKTYRFKVYNASGKSGDTINY